MVYLNDLKEAGVFKTRINLGEAFDPQHEPEQHEAYKDAFVEMRELTSQEAQSVIGAENQNDALLKVLPECLVNHNIVVNQNSEEKATNKQVMELVSGSSTIYTHVLQEWSSELPLFRRSGGNSGRSEST